MRHTNRPGPLVCVRCKRAVLAVVTAGGLKLCYECYGIGPTRVREDLGPPEYQPRLIG